MHEETVKIVDAQLGQMATQMSALDHFVTRARAQNDDMLEEHIGGLLQLSLQVAQLQTEASQTIDEHDTSLQNFQENANGANAELGSIVADLASNVTASVTSWKAGMEEGILRDYIPTGETPQKRDWTYPTQLPETGNHQSIIARMRGLPDPTIESKTPSTSRTPGRSPRKQTSPRKGSPSKAASPTKTKVFSDEKTQTITIPLKAPTENLTEPLKGLKEIDINVIPRPASAAGEIHMGTELGFSKSVGSGQPPLKRHATAGGESRVPTKTRTPRMRGVENLSQSIGPGAGRRLRNSPQD